MKGGNIIIILVAAILNNIMAIHDIPNMPLNLTGK
jgi:hypothetical protein